MSTSDYRNKSAERGLSWVAAIEAFCDAFALTPAALTVPAPATARGLPMEAMQPAINFRRRFYRFDPP